MNQPVKWPDRYDVIGAPVSAATYEESIDCIMQAAQSRQPATVSCHAVHAVVSTVVDDDLKKKVRQFELVCPDGQPVRWALRWLYGIKLADRVYGPELTIRLCRRAAELGVSVYLYGSTPKTLAAFEKSLKAEMPELEIAGSESPPFRALTPEEDAEAVDRINNSGAGILFIGLGCPKQDHFAGDHIGQIHPVQVCVGAAFDFHAGVLSMAPRWMQRSGLEWLYRLYKEPRRLAWRYLSTNSLFLYRLAKALLGRRDKGVIEATTPPSVAKPPTTSGIS